MDMIQKYFNTDKLTKYDKVSTIVYLILTLIISKITLIFSDVEIQKETIVIYGLLTHFSIYLINYKSLRNLKMFIIWTGIGLIHIFLFKYLSNNPVLMGNKRHAAFGLQFTIYFVILFEIIRIIHLKLFKYELVSLVGAGRSRDLWENRRIKTPDIICFFSYFIIWVIFFTVI